MFCPTFGAGGVAGARVGQWPEPVGRPRPGVPAGMPSYSVGVCRVYLARTLPSAVPREIGGGWVRRSQVSRSAGVRPLTPTHLVAKLSGIGTTVPFFPT